MNPAKSQISELQEITFWQQLNKQLIEKKSLDEPVTDQNQKILQKFCFENRLFHRITKDPLIDEMPVAMVTDFKEVNIFTYYMNNWVECLTTLLPNSIALDVEQALADAFDAMADLDRKYRFFETTPSDFDADNDMELYAFINEYNAIIEKQGREFNNTLRFLYELKAFVINKIDKEHDGTASLVIGRNDILLNFHYTEDREQIMSTYLNDFCNQAATRIFKFTDATSVLLDMEIHGLLDNKESEPKLKPSIREFIQHKRQLLERQSKLMRKFNVQLQNKLKSESDYRIKILNLSPFAFLKSPFPEV